MYVNDYSLLTSPVFANRAEAGGDLGMGLLAQVVRADLILGTR